MEFAERTARANIEKAYKAKFEDLEAKRREVISYGDIEEVQLIEEQQRKLQEQHMADMRQQTPAQEPQISPVLQEFIEENPWFNSDPEMTAYAQLLDQQAVQLNQPLGATAKEHYAAVAEKTKAMFKKNKATPKANVAAPSATMKSKPKQVGIQDLTPEQQSSFKYFQKHLGMKPEDYIKSLKDQGAI
jgi:hypothetical protein